MNSCTGVSEREEALNALLIDIYEALSDEGRALMDRLLIEAMERQNRTGGEHTTRSR